MTIDFTCQKCEASFELDAQDLIDGTEKLTCPHCNAKAPQNLTDDFVAALAEMRTQVAALGKKFSVNMAVETEDLEDEAADDEADDDEDVDSDEDDDLDFDEDDDVDDDDEDLEDEDQDER
jgi:hypothetical protein